MTNRKQTVLFLSHRIPFPPNKGEKIRSFNQIKYLNEIGHQVHVCAPIESESDHNYVAGLQEFCTSARTLKGPGPLRLISGLLKNMPLSVANFYSNQAQDQFDEMIRQINADIIMCSASSVAEYIFNSKALKQSEFKKTKLIMDFMDLDSDKWRQYKDMKKFPLNLIYLREEKLLFKYEQRIHRKFDTSFFISQAEVDLFHSRDTNLGKVHVIENGLDTDFFKPAQYKSTPTKPILLFTGVMDYFPNVDAVEWFVKNTWTDIKKKFPEAEFIIAGMNPTSRVKSLARYSGVEVTGFVDDIREYYDKADFFIAPFQVARGVQNKVLQAFACGLPVIGTRAAFEGINCNKNHGIVAEQTEDYVETISSLLSDKELRTTLSKNALTLIQKEYSWSGCLKALNKMVEV